MKSFTNYKRIIKSIFWIIMGLISFLTFQAISSTENWEWFNLDFDNRDHIIGAYGTLIGGILAFLSILFVLYQVYEQREQIIEEKNDLESEKRQDLKDRLLLLSDFLESIIKDIKNNGNRMEEFYNSEKLNPSVMNTMYFTINKNFQRITELDDLSMYRAIKYYLKDIENWQKYFLNLYSIIDFYSEALIDLREKYSLHINDKVKQQKDIAHEMQEFLTLNARLIDDYRIKYGENNYLDYSWAGLSNNFIPVYYQYLEQIQANDEVPNFRYISDDIIQPFIIQSMDIRRDSGFDDLGSRQIVEKASYLRKRIWEVEIYCLQYAEDIEKQFENYFSSDNDSINSLSEINDIIKERIN